MFNKDRLITFFISTILVYSLLYLLGLAHFPFQDRKSRLAMVVNNGDSRGSAYWLTKHGLFFSKDDHVALFFGYVDDYEGCKIVADLLVNKYSSKNLYTCNKVNHYE